MSFKSGFSGATDIDLLWFAAYIIMLGSDDSDISILYDCISVTKK